ncbi:FadR family transcriptional regulator [Nocardia higoensis]|uniref:FadR family transcriptional regulator n=1 Tax=Nocardia higoensis TaxID=228599 RepID=A0ABS0DEG8_9NOCA|nr:GntR family transcriptional regulator [Nocardia higoensis]MBF6356857.1 FadR family transcriptional regulator [Nocardia higoensis]
MALQPVVKRSVSAEVFEQIADEVLSGERAPGSALPSERQLAEALGVSRPAVREALQRLAGAGLVAVRQGDTTTVLDYRRGSGLEILPRLLIRQGTVDPTVARSILEARLHNAPKVAELAALRTRPADRERLRRTLDTSLTALANDTEPIALQVHALEFWEHLVDAADSLVFRLMNNMLRAAYEPALAALAPLMTLEVGNAAGYRAVAEAVLAGDGAAAAERAHTLLAPATTSLIAALDSAIAAAETPTSTQSAFAQSEDTHSEVPS